MQLITHTSVPYQTVNLLFIWDGFLFQEREQLRRAVQRSEDDMARRTAADKKALAAILKREAATRSMMYRESLRISVIDNNSSNSRSQIKQVSAATACLLHVSTNWTGYILTWAGLWVHVSYIILHLVL